MAAYFRESELEKLPEIIQLPFRDACAQLRVVLPVALPPGLRLGLPKEEANSLAFRIHDDDDDRSLTVRVEYLASNASRLVYEYWRGRREEPTTEELALVERGEIDRAQIEAHYAWVREKQARARQIRETVIEGVTGQWKELQRKLETMGSDATEIGSLSPPKAPSAQRPTAALRRRNYVLKAIPYLADEHKNLELIADLIGTTSKTLSKGIKEFGEADVNRAIEEYRRRESGTGR